MSIWNTDRALWCAQRNDRTADVWSEVLVLVFTHNSFEIDTLLSNVDRTGLDPTLPSAIRAQRDWVSGDTDGAVARLLAAARRRTLGPYESLVLGLLFLTLSLHDEALPHLLDAHDRNAWDPRLAEGLAAALHCTVQPVEYKTPA